MPKKPLRPWMIAMLLADGYTFFAIMTSGWIQWATLCLFWLCVVAMHVLFGYDCVKMWLRMRRHPVKAFIDRAMETSGYCRIDIKDGNISKINGVLLCQIEARHE